MSDRKAGIIALFCVALTSFPCMAQNEGRRVFVDEGCAVCHGLMGEGGVGPKLVGNPILALPQTVIGLILRGAGEMPAFGGKLTDAQIAAVAKHVRESWGNHYGSISAQDVAAVKATLKGAQAGGQPATGTAAPASPAAKPASQGTGSNQRSEGQLVFVDAGCAVCHGLMGEGGVGPKLRENTFLARAPQVAGLILIGSGAMPSFAGRLSDAQIAAVASYIRDHWGNQYGKVSPQEVAAEKATAQLAIGQQAGSAAVGTPGQQSGAAAQPAPASGK